MKRSVRAKGGEDEGLFVDLDFPANDTALFSDSSTPIAELKGCITWLRPQEICPSPALFPENVSLGFAKQGLLGDCWLLCACTILLENKHLLNRVFPPDQPLWGDNGYKGFFCFTFWQYGHWTEIIIDDLLPCVNSKLCFSQCLSPTAFWVPLLEKAYAKLHGSYETLWAGQVSEALVDLTGGLAERWSLGGSGSEEKNQQDKYRVRRQLGHTLLKSMKDNCILSCSTNSGPVGTSEVGQYHAINVLEWLDLSTLSGHKLHLFRMRNPWGRCCWDGSWIKSGAGWSTLDPLHASDLQGRLSQGEFWLDEEEFMSMFDDVTAGYLVNEEGHIKNIYSGNVLVHNHQLAGEWIKGYSAGGSRNSNSYSTNPKYWLKVLERGEVLISLLQHKERKGCGGMSFVNKTFTKHQHYQAIALHIWKVERKRFNLSRVLNKPPVASTHCHAFEREVVLHKEFESGYYLLIPSTYQPEAQTRFLIRVFSSSSISLSALKSSAPLLPLISDGEWEATYFEGAWNKGSTAGGSRNYLSYWSNPCFPFSVSDNPVKTQGVNIKISLHQNHSENELHPIGFHIYSDQDGVSKLKSSKDADPVASCIPHCYNQVVTLSCHLLPGVYTIVPSTYEPDCTGSFTICLSHRVQRKVVKCQETLGRAIQEMSYTSLMPNCCYSTDAGSPQSASSGT